MLNVDGLKGLHRSQPPRPPPMHRNKGGRLGVPKGVTRPPVGTGSRPTAIFPRGLPPQTCGMSPLIPPIAPRTCGTPGASLLDARPEERKRASSRLLHGKATRPHALVAQPSLVENPATDDGGQSLNRSISASNSLPTNSHRRR